MSPGLRKDLGLDLQQWVQLEKSVKYELNLKKNCVGLKGHRGQAEKWDLWFREFVQGDNMKIFKKLKGETELCRNQQLVRPAENTTRATQALTCQPKASSEQQIRELFAAGKRTRNALIRKTLGLSLPQWDALLRKICGGLIEWARGFNSIVQLSRNDKTNWDKWLRWAIKDSDGCWSNRQVDFNVLLACFSIMGTTMMESGFSNSLTRILQTAAATNHTDPPAQSSVVALKLNACQSKGTLPDMSCVKKSPGCAPAPGGVSHPPGKTVPHPTHFKQNIRESGLNQGRKLDSAAPVKNPGPPKPSFATKEESGITQPSAFRGDMKFEPNALRFKSRPPPRLPKKPLAHHGIGGLQLYKDTHHKTSQQLIPQPLGAHISTAVKRPLLDSCKSLVVPCVKFRKISDETSIFEVSAQATTAQPGVWVPAPRKSSLEEEDDYDVF
ncbi:hypothetical protein Q9L58_006126 [Maublancomyces gigas]|uniref:Uncharacterized protein n=1 Tax=Discina gigas TaxID=1032678 RepID=A0ABR3GGP4_9PEZI